MRLILAATAVTLLGAAAPAPPPVPPVHQLTFTNDDLATLGAAARQVGKTCGPTNEESCLAQLRLDELIGRLTQQLNTEALNKVAAAHPTTGRK